MQDAPLLLINIPFTLAISIAALWLGYQINQRIHFLHHYNIPPAVSGGLPISALIALGEVFSGWQIRFDLQLRDLLLIAFFSTIGLSARFRQMLEGGKALAIMLGLATVLLLFQNFTGIGLAVLVGESPLYGLVGGSISLAGGHGTAITWGQLFEQHFALENATALGMTFATAGLITGGVLGGPVAAFLIRRNNLYSQHLDPAMPHVEMGNDVTYMIGLNSLLTAVLLITLCFAMGASVYNWVAESGIRVPAFLTAMFFGIVLTNLLELCRFKLDQRPIQLVGDLSLQLFLGMSLISLPLLSLQGALGMISLLMLAQAIVITLFTVWLVFPALGRNYDAACISAGFIGMGLGATPVGIANMNALTNRFGPSPKAYLVIPLLGAFFIDIANATLVQILLGFGFFNP